MDKNLDAYLATRDDLPGVPLRARDLHSDFCRWMAERRAHPPTPIPFGQAMARRSDYLRTRSNGTWYTRVEGAVHTPKTARLTLRSLDQRISTLETLRGGG